MNKLEHIDTIIKPERVYTAETLDMVGKGGLNSIKKIKSAAKIKDKVIR